LHTSLRPEPFGRVVLEAMQAGVPVIAARAGGVPEIITPGEHGLLAEPGDVLEYYRQLERLMAAEPERCQLRSAALARVKGQFSVNRVSQQLSRLLKELV
jgi:glycosyltransferase involved in cell wall biosynthesis